MDDSIRDGTGTGNRARVAPNNGLDVNARVLSFPEYAAQEQNAFIVDSGLVNLTSDSASAVLYLKNTNTSDFLLDLIHVYLGNTTDGDGDWLVEILLATTAISTSTDASVLSRYVGVSGAALDVTATTGAEAATLTSGDALGFPVPAAGVFQAPSLVLALGRAIGVRVTPPPGNTYNDVRVVVGVVELVDV